MRVLAMALMLLLSACTRAPEPIQHQIYTFGTLVDITLWGVSQAKGEQALAMLTEDFARMHQDWHPSEGGALAAVNERLMHGEAADLPESLLPLVRRSTELSVRSGGLFNPAIGRLIRLWGFSNEFAVPTAPPAGAEIEALVARAPSMQDLTLEGNVLRPKDDAAALDFGAFAKGYAVDRAIERLRGLGIEHAIVNAGGDLRAIGRRGERPWRIGIRQPRGKGILASLETRGDESVFTSGDYERFFEHEGRRYHHILDPRSGYPAQGATSVTVVSRDAALADAAATALLVAGPEHWVEVAKAMGVSEVMLVDGTGKVHMTPALAARIRFEVTPAPEVELSESL